MQDDPRYDDVVDRGLRLPGPPGRVGRGAAASPASGSPSTRESASARRIAHNLEILRNLERFDNAGMCDPDRHVAQGVSGHDHRPAGGRARDGLGRSRRWRRAVRGARVVRVHDVARDGRRDQGLDGGAGLGGFAMSTRRSKSTSASNRSSIDQLEPVPRPGPGGQARLAAAGRRPRRRQERLAASARPPRCVERREEILAANARDVAAAPAAGLSAAAIDRLTLEPQADRRDGPEPARRRRAARPDRRGRHRRAGGPTAWRSGRSASRSASSS